MGLAIIQADYIASYKIKLIFSDKKEKVIDFEPFLMQSKNPTTRKYLKLKCFKNFSIVYGDLVWNDYELCFPIIDLYEDKISPKVSTAA